MQRLSVPRQCLAALQAGEFVRTKFPARAVTAAPFAVLGAVGVALVVDVADWLPAGEVAIEAQPAVNLAWGVLGAVADGGDASQGAVLVLPELGVGDGGVVVVG